MVHYGFVAEGYWDSVLKFLDYFHGKEYANGKAKVRCRIMLPIHFGINECGEKEFMADLKSFIDNYEDIDNLDKQCKKTGRGAKVKFRWYMKIFYRMFPQLKSFDKEITESNDNELRKKLEQKGEHYIMSLYPVGKMLDNRREDGVEYV